MEPTVIIALLVGLGIGFSFAFFKKEKQVDVSQLEARLVAVELQVGQNTRALSESMAVVARDFASRDVQITALDTRVTNLGG